MEPALGLAVESSYTSCWVFFVFTQARKWIKDVDVLEESDSVGTETSVSFWNVHMGKTFNRFELLILCDETYIIYLREASIVPEGIHTDLKMKLIYVKY
jgi:hypothetical protein